MKLIYNVFYLALAVGMTLCAQAALVNPGFETGDRTGWTTDVPFGGFADVVTSHTAYGGGYTYLPPDGLHFLRLTGSGNESLVTVSQNVFLRAGEAITVWAAFDMRGLKTYDQEADVFFNPSADSNPTTVWHEGGLNSNLPSTPTHTSWQKLILTASTTGNYTLAFDVYQQSAPNGSYESVVGLFDVVVPEPSTWLAGGLLGLIAIGSLAAGKMRMAA
jgi:hypothetical protein